jgi:hypothetical protein
MLLWVLWRTKAWYEKVETSSAETRKRIFCAQKTLHKIKRKRWKKGEKKNSEEIRKLLGFGLA